jgi:hypothetical protein
LERHKNNLLQESQDKTGEERGERREERGERRDAKMNSCNPTIPSHPVTLVLVSILWLSFSLG